METDIKDFTNTCAKRFCPWCGKPVIPNRVGRKRIFCSDKCRWAFWRFEYRHKDIKLQLEEELNENS